VIHTPSLFGLSRHEIFTRIRGAAVLSLLKAPCTGSDLGLCCLARTWRLMVDVPRLEPSLSNRVIAHVANIRLHAVLTWPGILCITCCVLLLVISPIVVKSTDIRIYGGLAGMRDALDNITSCCGVYIFVDMHLRILGPMTTS
jgi:hypothetical protein